MKKYIKSSAYDDVADEYSEYAYDNLEYFVTVEFFHNKSEYVSRGMWGGTDVDEKSIVNEYQYILNRINIDIGPKQTFGGIGNNTKYGLYLLDDPMQHIGTFYLIINPAGGGADLYVTDANDNKVGRTFCIGIGGYTML